MVEVSPSTADEHKADAGLDQTPREQGFLAVFSARAGQRAPSWQYVGKLAGHADAQELDPRAVEVTQGDLARARDGSLLAFTALTTGASLTGPQPFRLPLPAASHSPSLIGGAGLNDPQGTTALASNTDGSAIALSSAWVEHPNEFLSIPHTALVLSRPQGGLTKPTASWSVPKVGGIATLGDSVTITGSTPDSGVTVSAKLALRRWSGLTLVDAEVVDAP